MTVGHLAAGFKAAGSITLNWQQQGTYVDKLPHVLGLAARRWPDNKKNEQHFQTPPMAPQKKGSHDCGPFGGRFGSCWLNHTQLAAARGTYVDKLPHARVGRQALARQQKERATLPDPSNGTTKEGEP